MESTIYIKIIPHYAYSVGKEEGGKTVNLF